MLTTPAPYPYNKITILPIALGQSLTLTLSSPSFFPNLSSPLSLTLTPGSQVYAQVDSANTGVATGAVLEADETNNILKKCQII